MNQRSVHDLDHWEAFCSLVSTNRRGQRTASRDVGFTADGSEVARFAYRYRLAKSFQTLTLEGYSDEAIRGYAALFRLFLVYSAFEQFIEITGKTVATIQQSLARFRDRDWFEEFKRADPCNGLLIFLESKVDSRALKTKLHDAISGTPISAERLAAAVRHIFAHGRLTPFDCGDLEVGGEPDIIARACSSVSDFLLYVMNSEFTAAVMRASASNFAQ